VRTVSDPAARKGVTSPSGTSSTGAEDQPSLADIGARVGQDNEALRNLLIDTDRRINAIDDAKNAFRKLSEPISTALRDLAQEKIDNAGLRRELAELHTSHDALRDEFSALQQRAAALESDRDSLRRELARTQQDARGLEGDKAELTSEIVAARTRLEQMDANVAAAEVERAALSAARDEANSEIHVLNRRLEAIRSRAATAEKLLSEARQSLVARAEEVRIAERKTADATIARNTTQKLVEQLTAARDALEGKTKELERGRASLIERSHILAETVKARETALGQAEQEIKSLTDHIREIELEVAAYRGQAERRIEELNASLERERATARDALDGKTREFEEGRASLTERLAGLADTLRARESALGEAEQKIKLLSDRIAAIEADAATYRAEAERRISDLNARLDREREGFAAARHALDAKLRELELARASLTKRSNAMAGTLWARESALADAEQKVRSLTDHIAQIEIEVGAYRAQAERRIEELNAALDRERFEFAVAQEKSREAYAQLQGNGSTERPAQQERTDSDEVFKPAELKGPIVSTSEAIHNSKVLKAKLAKIAEEVLNTAAPALDRSGSAQPHGASESRRPPR
jgi:crescentin